MVNWDDYGFDSKGRPIGNAHYGTCDYPGCNREINRGTSMACGDRHGSTFFCCEGYFCYPHKRTLIIDPEGNPTQVCLTCLERLKNSDDIALDKNGRVKLIDQEDKSKSDQ